MPRPDYPKSLPDFIRMFPSEQACWRYVVESRWPNGFNCPKCGSAKSYFHEKRRIMDCAACGYQASATAGTALHRTKTPLMKWFLAAYFVATDKRGVSATYLESQLGLSTETAWGMLHKLRAAMVAPEQSMLKGTVELDESYLGAAKQISEKTLIAGAVEVRKGKDKKGESVTFPVRARFRHVPSRQAEDLLRFAIETIEEGSAVVTDGLSSYNDLPLAGFKRKVERAVGGRSKDDVLKHYHLVVSNLKTWLQGTFHGRVDPKHLQAYLNEYCFRFNRRNNPQAAFQTLLRIAGSVRAPEYDELYAGIDADGAWKHANQGASSL